MMTFSGFKKVLKGEAISVEESKSGGNTVWTFKSGAVSTTLTFSRKGLSLKDEDIAFIARGLGIDVSFEIGADWKERYPETEENEDGQRQQGRLTIGKSTIPGAEEAASSTDGEGKFAWSDGIEAAKLRGIEVEEHLHSNDKEKEIELTKGDQVSHFSTADGGRIPVRDFIQAMDEVSPTTDGKDTESYKDRMEGMTGEESWEQKYEQEDPNEQGQDDPDKQDPDSDPDRELK